MMKKHEDYLYEIKDWLGGFHHVTIYEFSVSSRGRGHYRLVYVDYTKKDRDRVERWVIRWIEKRMMRKYADALRDLPM